MYFLFIVQILKVLSFNKVTDGYFEYMKCILL